ncbi:MAG: amidase [Dehalococcoidia bacterium]|nr:amidase [Dehalococcoidia bacterium]
MNDTYDLTTYSASKLAELIRNNVVSSEEVVKSHISRIKEVNPKLNAVVVLTEKSALNSAREADSLTQKSKSLPPLHGVPVTIKDAFEVAGVISTGGTLGRKDYVPNIDATSVKRLKQAGAIILGKTNLPEISMGFESSNLVYGTANNPFDVKRIPGGSSGGEASIIAAGGSPFGIGSDAGGSIRWPAHCCGIVGMKPTTGRAPRTGHWPAFSGIFSLVTQIGPMARSVEDIALTLPLLSGPDGVDPTVMPIPLNDPAKVKLSDLNIAFHTDNGLATPIDEIQNAVNNAAGILETKVKSIEQRTPEALKMSASLHSQIMGADAGETARVILKNAGSNAMDPNLLSRINMMSEKPAYLPDFLDTLVELEEYRSQLLQFMERTNTDVMIGPAAPVPAPLHGHGYDGFPENGSYSHAYNLAGWPALVMRGGTSKEGLPVGIQVISKPWCEEKVIAVALELEKNLETFPGPKI